MSMKRFLVVVAAAVAFLVGYGGAAQAWPGVPDRDRWHGYFTNTLDDQGDRVLPNGYPSWVDTAGEFISYTRDMLYNGTAREQVGANFLIQIMLAEPWNRNRPPTGDQMADWESRVWRAANHGWISWNANFTYSGNSYWQGNNGGGSNPNDDAFYYENGTRLSIIFRNSSGQAATVIKRDCANPLTNGYMPGLEELWNSHGWTDVPATAIPDQTVTFRHYVQNFGETAARIWYAAFEGDSSAGTGLPGASGSNVTQGGQTINVANENFKIPTNAANGTRYCRLIGWDPTNSWGGRDGRGSEACVTVVIPAKLRAAMSVNPPTIAPGDETTFQPSISASQNTSPINVQCSITRTIYTPAGVGSSLGAQPCVNQAGSTTITIGVGTSVLLRANTYSAPDTIAIGSRVCDVITITNPSGAGYYDNYPDDQTSEACVRIAKSPYVHFTGGDVWAGGGFAALGACTNNADIRTVTRNQALDADGTRPGSGVTYAAFALGRITSFGSASMGQVTATGLGDNWTFANTNTANLGFFNSGQHCIPDYVSTYQGAPLISGTNINIGGAGNGAWRVNGDANFVGATMGAGVQRVYFVNGNATINNSLTYPASFSNGGQLPSLVIIATGDIRVAPGVTQMDGIFISRGTFYTCYPKTEPATISTCNQRLTVNGSVSSNRVDLFRTAGADGATPALQKAPAEVFNLSPEVYVSNALNQTSQATITTSQVRELPPRF